MGSQSDVRNALDNFGDKLDALEDTLRPVLAALDEARSNTDGEDLAPFLRARVDVTLAYALNAAFCMYLRTLGQDPASHPVLDEISRVRDAYLRIHALDGGRMERPRKRSHAALLEATKRLSGVLTDGERLLHQAISGKTTPVPSNGQRTVFDLSSDDEGGSEGGKDATRAPQSTSISANAACSPDRESLALTRSESAEDTAERTSRKSTENKPDRKSGSKKRKRKDSLSSGASKEKEVKPSKEVESSIQKDRTKDKKKKRDSSKKHSSDKEKKKNRHKR